MILDRALPTYNCGEAATSALNSEPKSPVTPNSKKPEHASSVFWLFYWRRSRTVIFHFTHRRSTPESLATSSGLAMYRNMQEIRRRDGICFPKAPPSPAFVLTL